MTKELQDYIWACLPKEASAEIKKLWELDTLPIYPDYDIESAAEGAAYILTEIFGHHNLTSNSEPKEMLILERAKVSELYSNLFNEYNKETKDTHAKISLSSQIALLEELFTKDKCLLGKEKAKISASDWLNKMHSIADQCIEAIDKDGNKQALNIGDKVRVKGDDKVRVVYRILPDGHIMFGDKGGIYSVDDLELYTEENEDTMNRCEQCGANVQQCMDVPCQNYLIEKNKETKLTIGTHIRYNGDEYKIVGNDEVGYKVKVINPTGEDYATHISYKAPFEILEKELNLCELLKGCEGETFYSDVFELVILTKVNLVGNFLTINWNRLELNLYSNGSKVKGNRCVLWPSKELYEKYPLDAYSAWMEWKEARKHKRWRAKQNKEFYYFLDDMLLINDIIDSYDYFCNNRYNTGNYFRTKEEASQACEIVKKVLKEFHEHNKKL